MNVLIFDANLGFGHHAVEVIKRYMPNTRVDFAQNAFILEKRLAEGKWHVVLADVTASGFLEEVLDTLDNAKCPVIIWRSKPKGSKARNYFRLMTKPADSGEMCAALFELMRLYKKVESTAAGST